MRPIFRLEPLATSRKPAIHSLLLHCTTLDVRPIWCNRARVSRKLILILLSSLSLPAQAQRTGSNAVTSADDAFGRAVGNERIGIYSQEDVRGFNPVDAGNVRIEGLYFDQQSQPSNRVVDRSAIRVGYGVRGYPFPAPTGILDLSLEKYEGKRISSIDLDIDDHANVSGSISVKLPLVGDELGVTFGQGFRLAKQPGGRSGHFNSQAVILTWRPSKATEVSAFWSAFDFNHGIIPPFIYPLDNQPPKQIDRTLILGQDWAQNATTSQNYGITAKFRVGALRIDAGLFRSTRLDNGTYSDLMLGTTANGKIGSRTIIADQGNDAASTSGELRVVRVWQDHQRRHSLILSTRGRDQFRNFGGQQSISIPVNLINDTATPNPQPRPNLLLLPNDHSTVQQLTLGLGYDLQWLNHGSFGVAIQKTDYRKHTVFANTLITPTQTSDKPWLFSVNAAINLTPSLIAYGGYVSGLEESAVAPDRAINRSEAPPALRSTQKDLGLRYTIKPGLNLIAGVFDIQKPFYGIDPGLRFRQLGIIHNRGIELSLAGALAPGLSIVTGALFLDPKISGPDVTSGLIGERPVASFKQKAIANLDWKPHGQEAWSFDLAFDAAGPATANSANSFETPARETVSLGARYRFKMGKARMLVRGQLYNLLDDYGWRVNSGGGWSFTLPRTFNLNLVADF